MSIKVPTSIYLTNMRGKMGEEYRQDVSTQRMTRRYRLDGATVKKMFADWFESSEKLISSTQVEDEVDSDADTEEDEMDWELHSELNDVDSDEEGDVDDDGALSQLQNTYIQ